MPRPIASPPSCVADGRFSGRDAAADRGVAGVIDHLVLAGPDLERLVAWFADLSGIAPVPSGAVRLR